MTRLTTALVCVLAALVTLAAQTPPLSKELTSLQGTWIVTEANGQDATQGGNEVALVVTGDKYAQTVNGNVVERGSIKLDGSKKPMAIDLHIAEGNDANKTQLGVIQIDEKSIMCKLNAPDSTVRPTDFTPADTAFTFVAKKSK